MGLTVTGRVVGLDIGDLRIGVAVSDPLGIIAQPHGVLQRASPEQDAEAVRRIVEKTNAVQVVAGIPLNQEGKPGPQAEKVLGFIEVLRRVAGVAVIMQDERYSTAAATRTLIEADVSRKRRKRLIDKLAAQHILQSYLDRRAKEKARDS